MNNVTPRWCLTNNPREYHPSYTLEVRTGYKYLKDLFIIVWQHPPIPPPHGNTLGSYVGLVLRLSNSTNKTNNKTKQNIKLSFWIFSLMIRPLI